MSEGLKFADALKKLEQIIEQLEAGVDDLDQVVELFEEGSEYIKFCTERLTNIETKIEVISNKLSKDNG